MDPLHGRPGPVVIGQGLTHAHKDHVGDPTVAGIDLGPDYLFHDLPGGQVAFEAHLAGGTEPAGHGATGLGAHADCGTVPVVHKDCLDEGAVSETPQPLHSPPPVAHRAGVLYEGGRKVFGQVPAEGGGQRGHLLRFGQVAVQALPQLIQAVGGLTGQQVSQGVASQVVPARGKTSGRWGSVGDHRTMRW